MKSYSCTRKALRSGLTVVLLTGAITAAALGAAAPAKAEFCAYNPETGQQECWYDDELELNDPPYNYLPTIKGTMAIGSTLTAESIPNDIPWTSLTYQWLRNGMAVAGATSSSFKLTEADIGQTMGLEVRGRATGYNDAGETFTAETPVVGYSLTAGEPSVSGTARVGSVLTVVPGGWTTGTSFTYRWLRNGVAITGATSTSFKLTELDRGQRVAVRVTGSKPLFVSLTKSVLGSGAVAPSARTLLNRTLPTLTGAPVVGTTLKATTGTWTQSGVTYRYQWLRDRSKPIPGATGPTYRVTSADLAARSLSVKVYAVKAGWTTGTALSAPVGRIAAAR